MAETIGTGKQWHCGMLELTTFLLYLLAAISAAVLHEPWFDEAQAWQIARNAGLSDILLEIPHYEGHPPLWHLILLPPAKLGVPFEVGLKAVATSISVASAWLVIFESPFPLAVRLLVPFNYFFFYQYGIMSRPYGLLLLLMLLLAASFSQRDSHPGRFVSLLALLCLTHAYGMLLSCGVAIAWTVDICREKGVLRTAREILEDPRTRHLLALLALGLATAASIAPRPDTFNPALGATTPLWERLLYSVVGMPADTLAVCSEWFSNDRALLQLDPISLAGLASSSVIGLVVWVGCFALSSRRNLKYLVIPYMLFALFGGVVYLAAHHVGVCYCLLLSWLWVALLDDGRLAGWGSMKRLLKPSDRDMRLVRGLCICVCTLFLCIPVWWTVTSVGLEANEQYGFGRGLSLFLKEHDLDDALIIGWCDVERDSETGDVVSVDTNLLGDNASLLAYFDRSIVANDDRGYLTYKIPTAEESEEKRRQWRALGRPDLLLGRVDLEWLYGGSPSGDDYEIVYLEKSDHIWKGRHNRSQIPVYLRKDLMDEYGLDPVELSPAERMGLEGAFSFKITDDMLESMRSGELTVDDVLDAFGI